MVGVDYTRPGPGGGGGGLRQYHKTQQSGRHIYDKAERVSRTRLQTKPGEDEEALKEKKGTETAEVTEE